MPGKLEGFDFSWSTTSFIAGLIIKDNWLAHLQVSRADYLVIKKWHHPKGFIVCNFDANSHFFRHEEWFENYQDALDEYCTRLGPLVPGAKTAV